MATIHDTDVHRESVDLTRGHKPRLPKRLASMPVAVGSLLTGTAIALIAFSVVPSGGGASGVVEAGSDPVRATAPPETSGPEHLSTVVRYNGSDRDAQLIVSLKDENQAIGPISLRRPGGGTILAERLAHPSTVGQSVVDVRTADGVPLRRLRRAYPAGSYRWVGRTVDGRRFVATTRVGYALPDAPTITAPSDETKGLPTSGVTIRWRPVADAQAIFVEVEEDADAGRELLVRLDGPTTSFTVPDGFLESRRDYAVEVKAVAQNGNQTAIDSSFSTG